MKNEASGTKTGAADNRLSTSTNQANRECARVVEQAEPCGEDLQPFGETDEKTGLRTKQFSQSTR